MKIEFVHPRCDICDAIVRSFSLTREGNNLVQTLTFACNASFVRMTKAVYSPGQERPNVELTAYHPWKNVWNQAGSCRWASDVARELKEAAQKHIEAVKSDLDV